METTVRQVEGEYVFKIKKDSNVRKVATAVVGELNSKGAVRLQGIGAGAINQMSKIAVHARGEVARGGKDLIIRPGMFNEIGSDGNELTVIIFNVSLV